MSNSPEQNNLAHSLTPLREFIVSYKKICRALVSYSPFVQTEQNLSTRQKSQNFGR